MLTLLDHAVIVFYFVFMAGIGWYFRRAGADSSDFFRGGGRMSWWMVGSSAFMVAFSAWTFTGAAGLAYDAGLIVLVMFAGNAVQLLIAAAIFAAWYRQTRAITLTEAIRQRLGLTNQQIHLWLSTPISLVRSAIWLYGLAIFLAPIFQLDVVTLIVVSGVVIIIIAAIGGSWAVVTGDFMQTLLLMPVSMLAAWLALEKTGGVGPLLDGLPAEHFDIAASSLPQYGMLWLIAMGVEKILLGNGLGWAGRFLYVSDSVAARRAALCAAGLFLFGTLIWFIPPLAARSLGMDLNAQFPGLSKPSEAAYAAMALVTLPPGLLGLLVTGLIAATLSSMDHGLNGNAGMVVRGIYHPLLRPKAAERELVLAGRVTTVIMGLVIMLLALKYSTWQGVGVFALMLNLTAMLATPQVVPMFWCLLTRRSPDWAFWSTLVVGFCSSALLGWFPREAWFVAWADTAGWAQTLKWAKANEYAVITLGNTVVCSIWFWTATLLGKSPSGSRRQEVNAFFTAMHTPVPEDPETKRAAASDGRSVERMSYLYGVFLLVIAAFPNSAWGHGGLLFCAAFFFGTGLLLRWAGKREARRALMLEQSQSKPEAALPQKSA